MPHIAIAGAGIAGLASAILLTRQGQQVTVFEQVADPTPVGAGLLLQPSGQMMLQNLGLLDLVRDKAAIVHSLEGYSGSWKTLDLHYSAVQQEWHGLGIHRAQLHSILWNCACESGVNIQLGNGIVDFAQDQQQVVVKHQHGESLADGLIIANGTRSQLRDRLAIKRIHKPYPWGAYWAVLDRDDWPFPHILMQRYRGAHIMLGILPTGINPSTNKTCYSLFWSLPKSSFADYQTAGMPGLIERIRAVWPEVAEWLASASSDTSIAIAEYADVRLATYHQQNVVVLGDAAHAMSPQLGQGANMALIDATILAQCLMPTSDFDKRDHLASAAVDNSYCPNIAQAFAQYSHRRSKHIAYYQMASRIMTPLYQSRYSLGWLRDVGTVVGRHLPAVYRQYMLTLCGAKQGTWDLRAEIADL
ncbi:FAD-dependent oxidoreductase [Undibacterium flavidum]|uniref:FAD-dependent monooxygenase n=1 Tax=Undibacterium flavidum TaxID=2762297 RepID=A0ABR6YGH1_9BURK|nr:NAD(P)/FAD-dependent oxidoreductase [Undibacterium flavidum]MBC3875669.1 FAD-dependent monooxygenase [Undibacterium flavidum]